MAAPGCWRACSRTATEATANGTDDPPGIDALGLAQGDPGCAGARQDIPVRTDDGRAGEAEQSDSILGDFGDIPDEDVPALPDAAPAETPEEAPADTPAEDEPPAELPNR